MSEKLLKDSAAQIRDLRVRLFEAAAEIDRGNDILFDCKGPANPFEQMYEQYGVSDSRPRRQR